MRRSVDTYDNPAKRVRKTAQARIVNCSQIPSDFFGSLHRNISEKKETSSKEKNLFYDFMSVMKVQKKLKKMTKKVNREKIGRNSEFQCHFPTIFLRRS